MQDKNKSDSKTNKGWSSFIDTYSSLGDTNYTTFDYEEETPTPQTVMNIQEFCETVDKCYMDERLDLLRELEDYMLTNGTAHTNSHAGFMRSHLNKYMELLESEIAIIANEN